MGTQEIRNVECSYCRLYVSFSLMALANAGSKLHPRTCFLYYFAWFKLLGRNQPSECSYDAPESQLPGFESQAISSH